MAVWITEVERLASVFPCLTQLNRDALFLQPAFPSRQITASDPECDVNCADGVRISSSAFLEQQQHAAITCTHRAKARLIVQGFAGFERLKAEYSAIEFSGASRTLDVQGCFQNPIYSRWHSGDITHVVIPCRDELEDHDLKTEVPAKLMGLLPPGITWTGLELEPASIRLELRDRLSLGYVSPSRLVGAMR